MILDRQLGFPGPRSKVFFWLKENSIGTTRYTAVPR